MYAGIKKATGPSVTKSVPLKSKSGEFISDQKKQMDHWVEHYLELYSTQNVVTDAALGSAHSCGTGRGAFNARTQQGCRLPIERQGPGRGRHSPEVITSGKDALIPDLHDLLIQFWREGSVPQDWRGAKIITLYKNKRDCSDCNCYRGISLLSIVGKILARVVLE